MRKTGLADPKWIRQSCFLSFSTVKWLPRRVTSGKAENVIQCNQMNMRITNRADIICKARSGDKIIVNDFVLVEKGKAFTQVVEHSHIEWRFPILTFYCQKMVFLPSDTFGQTIQLNGTAEPGILYRVIANRSVVNGQISFTVLFFQPEQSHILKGSCDKIPYSVQIFTEKYLTKAILNDIPLVKDEPIPKAKQTVSHSIVVGFLVSYERFSFFQALASAQAMTSILPHNYSLHRQPRQFLC